MLNFGNYHNHGQNKKLVDIWKDYLGTDLSAEAIYRLIGAPEESLVIPSFRDWKNEDIGEDRPPLGLYFDIEHSDFFACIGIYRTQENFRLYIKDFHKTKWSMEKGIAGQCLFQMAWMAHLLNIDEINLLGWGGRLCSNMEDGSAWSGHSTWPKYGFDMLLQSRDQDLSFKTNNVNTGFFEFFPYRSKELNDCTTLQDILKRSDGEDWWKICGTGWFMTFVCRGGQSGKRLVNKLRESHHSLDRPVHIKESHLSLNSTSLPVSNYQLTSSASEIERKLREGIIISAPQLDYSEFLSTSPELDLNV